MISKNKCIKKIILTVGLPASGKTTFCKNYVLSSSDLSVKHIEFDKHMRSKNGLKAKYDDILTKNINIHKDEIILIDIMLLKNKDVIDMINIINNNFDTKDTLFEIHYWNLNRDACLLNDIGRREIINCQSIIKHAPLEEINIDLVKKSTYTENILLTKHEVKIKKYF